VRHRGTPQPVIARLNAAILHLQTEALKERFATVGLQVTASTPAELAELVKEGLATRGEPIKSANILLD
jgi:tripartite-type tricarboxylate transporter receptor subunit TctC